MGLDPREGEKGQAGPGGPSDPPTCPPVAPADPDSFLKSARLQRLPSSSSEMGSQDGSPLRETRKDPFSAAASECSCRQDGLTVIVTACLTFATGVTVALVMQIYFGDPQVRGRSGEPLGLGNPVRIGRGGCPGTRSGEEGPREGPRGTEGAGRVQDTEGCASTFWGPWSNLGRGRLLLPRLPFALLPRSSTKALW